MRERMDASLGTKGPRAPTRESLRRRLARRMSLLVAAVGLLAFCSAGAAWGNNNTGGGGKATSVTPAEGCPGDVVTLTGTGFSTSGRNALEWSDEAATREQFGEPLSHLGRINAEALPTTSSTVEKAVVPLMLQVWEGPLGTHRAGNGSVKSGEGSS